MIKTTFTQISTSVDKDPTRIGKKSKDFATKLDFKDIKFPVRIRDIHKAVKKMYQHCCFRFSK